MVSNFLFTKENIYADCPECKFNWDKGDALECIKADDLEWQRQLPPNSTFPITTEDQLKKRALKNYGWTLENPVHLSRLTHLELSDGDDDFDGGITHYQCPNCFIAWHVITGERSDKFKLLLDRQSKMSELTKKFIKSQQNNND
jgi:hypothetical protein